VQPGQFEQNLGRSVTNETPADLLNQGDKNKNLGDIFEISEPPIISPTILVVFDIIYYNKSYLQFSINK